jgi:hypothetical protein
MKSIWKYPLVLSGGPQTMFMPAGARVVFVGEQNDRPVMWTEVGGGEPDTCRVFRIFGTGQPIPGGEYVGTAICGRFVWHVYEVTP